MNFFIFLIGATTVFDLARDKHIMGLTIEHNLTIDYDWFWFYPCPGTSIQCIGEAFRVNRG